MFCPSCGREVKEGSKFCPYCGKSFPQFQKEEKYKHRKNLKLLIIIPVVALLVISAGVFAYFSFFPRINPEKSSEYDDRGLEVLSDIVIQNKITDEKMLKEAEDNFKRAVKLDPDNISAKKNLVYAYLISDNYAEAKKEVEELLSKNPNNQFALKLKELLSEENP